MKPLWWFIVEGTDPTPDGYRDHLLYTGRSLWQAIKAVVAGVRNGMTVHVEFFTREVR